jgi:hypothetical protein
MLRPHLASPSAAAQTTGSSISGLHAQGNQLVNNAGQAIQLHGVDRSGTEYACIQGWGIFDGPSDAASVQAIASWHTNAVRVPLNEDCWLAINGAPAAYSGATYQTAISNYVMLLNSYGLAAILELHWNAPGTQQATGQQPMADQDHAPAFWTSVASAFKGNGSVIFDLYNEPYPDSNQDTTAAWQCWLNGGTCSGVSFPAAGMQELVTTVRNTGATNLILLGGVQYGGTVTQWLSYKPSDPLNNLAAGVHSYNFGSCTANTCWNNEYGPVAKAVPLIAGEIGENDCQSTYISPLMSWFDSAQQSYLAWTWDTWGTSCGAIALISSYSGTPATAYGQGYQAHLAALASSPSPTPTPSPTFSMAVSPSSLTLQPSGTGSYTVTVTASGGFSSAVALSVSGLPPGATASFSSSSVTPTPTGTTSTLTVTAGTKRGTFPLTITGKSGDLTQSAKATLIIKR